MYHKVLSSVAICILTEFCDDVVCLLTVWAFTSAMKQVQIDSIVMFDLVVSRFRQVFLLNSGDAGVQYVFRVCACVRLTICRSRNWPPRITVCYVLYSSSSHLKSIFTHPFFLSKSNICWYHSICDGVSKGALTPTVVGVRPN